MQEDRIFENKYAPPVRSEKKIGNTTFTVKDRLSHRFTASDKKRCNAPR